VGSCSPVNPITTIVLHARLFLESGHPEKQRSRSICAQASIVQNFGHVHREARRGKLMAFKLSREQLIARGVLTADLRAKAGALNIAIAEFNRGIMPLTQAVAEAQDAYNETLDVVRNLADGIAESAREQFDAKSNRWQNGDNGMRVQSWIEQWEMILDDIELDLPEPLEEIDPEGHAGELEDAGARPVELEHALVQ
jgi:hypothetical protein